MQVSELKKKKKSEALAALVVFIQTVSVWG